MFGKKTRMIQARDARIATLETQLTDAREDIGTARFLQDRADAQNRELTGEITELEARLRTSRNLNQQLNRLRSGTAATAQTPR
jgi:small-conductance mechanosensitive channel